jgi:hypothetical protein
LKFTQFEIRKFSIYTHWRGFHVSFPSSGAVDPEKALQRIPAEYGTHKKIPGIPGKISRF